MAVAGRNGQIRIWNVDDGARERDIETDGRRIRALAFSPDGTRLAAAGNEHDDSTSSMSATGEAGHDARDAAREGLRAACSSTTTRWPPAARDNRIRIWDFDSQHGRHAAGRPHRHGRGAGLRRTGTTARLGQLRHDASHLESCRAGQSRPTALRGEVGAGDAVALTLDASEFDSITHDVHGGSSWELFNTLRDLCFGNAGSRLRLRSRRDRRRNPRLARRTARAAAARSKRSKRAA